MSGALWFVSGVLIGAQVVNAAWMGSNRRMFKRLLAAVREMP